MDTSSDQTNGDFMAGAKTDDRYVYRLRYSADMPFHVGSKVKKSTLPGLHVHAGLEIGSVISGKGFFHIAGKQYPLKAGDVYFLDSMIPHGHRGGEDTRIDLLFAHLLNERVMTAGIRSGDYRLFQPFLAVHNGFPPVLESSGATHQALLRALEAYQSGDPQHDLIAWAHIVDALVELARVVLPCIEAQSDESAVKRNRILSRALDFIHSNVVRPISLDTIARSCFCSVSHLSHLFAENLHVSPIEYRNKLRISLAVRMLATTDDKLEKIAQDSGFESYSQFRLLFKRITGRTPGDYRADSAATQIPAPASGSPDFGAIRQ